MQNPYSKTFLDIKFLFVNWFSIFLRHILGLKECLIMIREYLYENVHSVVIREKLLLKDLAYGVKLTPLSSWCALQCTIYYCCASKVLIMCTLIINQWSLDSTDSSSSLVKLLFHSVLYNAENVLKIQRTFLLKAYEQPCGKTNKMSVRPAKTDQPGHLPNLIRVFAVRMKKAWVLSYPLSAQRRLWSDWVDAQADLSLRWVLSHFVGFVMRRLI